MQRAFANKDMVEGNICVKKGEALPEVWQLPSNANALKEFFGDDCIFYQDTLTEVKKNGNDGAVLESLAKRLSDLEDAILDLSDKLDMAIGSSSPETNKGRRRKISHERSD